jgi:hypothetical protein
MKEQFVERQFRPAALALIQRANVVIEEYQDQGFALTLRQLYYQFVARDLLANTPDNYKLLSRTIVHGRDAGLIDWDAIEDRTREVNTHAAWPSPASMIDAAARSYQEDLWLDQKWRPEVWIEKEALIGVIENVCTKYRVPYFAQRGSTSRTAKHDAGKRFEDYLDDGLTPIVLYLGDHDPTGIDITRDNEECLALYAREEVEVRRLALTIDQVRQHRPPPNAAKEQDANFKKYVREFGTNECWELDALSPAVIANLVEIEIKTLIKPRPWKLAKAKEAANRGLLEDVAADWQRVAERRRA